MERFKASGTTFSAWCKDTKINETVAPNTLKGVSTGSQGQKLVDRLIEGAGLEVVEVSYRVRMRRHVEVLEGASMQGVAA